VEHKTRAKSVSRIAAELVLDRAAQYHASRWVGESMHISVLMNTYNRAHLLRWALRSYLRQTENDFEIVVADDGSTDDTPAVVEAFEKEASFDIHYVRHEHRGHRRAAILNRGIERCRGDQVLFTDCDSLASSMLIAAHRRHARPDRLLCGVYVRLARNETEALGEDVVRSGAFEQLLDFRKRRTLLRKRLKARWEILRRKPRRPHNMGLNYSAPREALLRINGYDEAFVGWGFADGDVRERLRRIGVTPYSLYHRALVLHMWHPEETTKAGRARTRAHVRRPDIPVFCQNGIVKPGDATVGEARPVG
jgi:glycosyltransferase involved in cell wall biosynthesis